MKLTYLLEATVLVARAWWRLDSDDWQKGARDLTDSTVNAEGGDETLLRVDSTYLLAYQPTPGSGLMPCGECTSVGVQLEQGLADTSKCRGERWLAGMKLNVPRSRWLRDARGVVFLTQKWINALLMRSVYCLVRIACSWRVCLSISSCA